MGSEEFRCLRTWPIAKSEYEENHNRLQRGFKPSGPRAVFGILGIRSRCATHRVATSTHAKLNAERSTVSNKVQTKVCDSMGLVNC
jgi:hypothetical protein